MAKGTNSAAHAVKIRSYIVALNAHIRQQTERFDFFTSSDRALRTGLLSVIAVCSLSWLRHC